MVFSRTPDLTHWVGLLNLIIDCLLLLDVALNFRTGYPDKYDSLHIIQDPRRICKRYVIPPKVHLYFDGQSPSLTF